jgi:hypothetical protein
LPPPLGRAKPELLGELLGLKEEVETARATKGKGQVEVVFRHDPEVDDRRPQGDEGAEVLHDVHYAVKALLNVRTG